MASIGLKVIRGVFGVAEHFLPGLSGKAAFQLFARTPSPKSLTAGERRAIEQARSFMAEARHHRLRIRSGCVMAHEFRPERGRAPYRTVLVIHGWRSRTEYMRSLIDGYRAAGFRVIALDLPGHGASEGRRLHMANAVAAARAADEWFGPFAAVVGHSFGGAVAVNALVGSIDGIAPISAERLVLVAAPNSMPDFFDEFGRHLNLGPRSQRAIVGEVERIAGRPLSEFVGAKQLSGLTIPTLVMHSSDDREVTADNAEAFGSAGSNVRLIMAQGLGHRRILSDSGIVAAAVEFATRRQAPASVH